MTAIAPLAAGGSKAAFSIRGGNSKISEGLLKGKDVRMGHTVKSIEQGSDGKYSVTFTNSTSIYEEQFDYVVISTPLYGSDIIDKLIPIKDSFDNVEYLSLKNQLSYQEVHTTFVKGTLSSSFFSCPNFILLNSLTDILSDASVGFNSIGNYRHFNATTSLWKIFSQKRMGFAEIDEVMDRWDHESVLRHEWKSPGAYPQYKPVQQIPSFVVHQSEAGMVLYPSALEQATSAMEVMAVSAKNAALLVQ